MKSSDTCANNSLVQLYITVPLLILILLLIDLPISFSFTLVRNNNYSALRNSNYALRNINPSTTSVSIFNNNHHHSHHYNPQKSKSSSLLSSTKENKDDVVVHNDATTNNKKITKNNIHANRRRQILFKAAAVAMSPIYAAAIKANAATTTSESKIELQEKQEVKATDEITITIPKSSFTENKKGLGIELSELKYRDNIRVYAKSIQPGSIADLNGVQPDYVFVSINNQSLERTDAKGVSIYFKRALEEGASTDDIKVTFRIPNAFRDQLSNLEEGQSATTQIAPGKVVSTKTTPLEDQKVTVTQIKAPSRKICSHPADTDDLLEISYIGTILPSNQLFDSSNLKINDREIPGRGGDITLYFVLGKQPLGQFPPGWDVSMYGMCIGETRRIVVPPILAYGDVGVPRRGIPPNATLQYDVTLVSVNGIAVDNTPVYDKYTF